MKRTQHFLNSPFMNPMYIARNFDTMKKLLFFCFLFSTSLSWAQDLTNNKVLQTIALGSCNRQEAPQPMWPLITQHNPDLWIWLGDNIYGDTNDMQVMKDKYNMQKSNPGYQALIAQTDVIGIWDDHDFGVNDGGKEYPKRAESKALMFDFLDVPKDHPAQKREAAYQSYLYGEGDQKVKIILLDARYDRDALERENRRYQKNWEGKIMSDEQWNWLEKELAANEANIHIIASGIQFIATEHPYEKWDNFPKERQRMLDVIVKTQANNVLMLSGDRHISELASYHVPGYGMIYDFTSSGMTHSYSSSTEYNSYRMGKLITDKSFGLMQLLWAEDEVKLTIEMRSETDEVQDRAEIVFQK